jgi:hypothetical protein
MFAGPASADRGFHSQVGNTEIQVPAPVGFVASRQVLPAYREKLQPLYEPGMELLDAFLSQRDARLARGGHAPAFDRYFVVCVSRRFEKTTFTEADFADVRAHLRSQLQRITDAVRDEIRAKQDAFVRDLDIPSQASSHGTGEKVLDVFIDRAHAFAYIAVETIETRDTNGVVQLAPTASVAVVALVSGKMLNLYGYATYRSGADLAWLRHVATRWSWELEATNRERGDVPRPPPKAPPEASVIGLLATPAP